MGRAKVKIVKSFFAQIYLGDMPFFSFFHVPRRISPIVVSVAIAFLPTHLALALSPAQVNEIAKNTTVRIHSQAPGSGVIIKRQGNLYTVLTAAHVVATEDDYEVITRDGQTYPLIPSQIQKFTGIDLALVKFESDRDYATAKLGNSTALSEGSVSYVAGFPMKTAAIDDIIYNFTSGTITANAARPLRDGYSLVYSNSTLPGMSGGPVLNADGELMGIHGRADTTTAAQDQSVNPDIFIKTGFNLGIPTALFINQAPPGILDNTVVQSISRVAAAGESRADDFYLQALDQYRNGQMSEALGNVTQAIARNSKYAPAYSLRGVLRLVNQDRFGALADFDQALSRDPNLVQAYIGRALVKSNQGDPAGAIADYSTAITLQDNHSILYYNRGIVFYNQGNNSEALSDLKTAANLALKADNQTDYQRAIDAIAIASKDCTQSIRSICDR